MATALAHSTVPAAYAMISQDLADLAGILEPGVNLCMVRRQPEMPVETFVAALLKQAGDIELSIPVRLDRFDFLSLLKEFRELQGHAAWCRDVARLAATFCDLFETEEAGLRLRTLNNAMCPRFHVDHVPCRLVCTYGGLGTQWLPDDAVDRSKLGHRAHGLPDEESGLILHDEAVREMPSYAIGLLKGAKWPGFEERGIVHRSPRPTPEHPRRLLLTLDLL